MGRYYTEKKPPNAGGDMYGNWIPDHISAVRDHVPTNTGLVNANGDAIMRSPNPIGFVWESIK